MFLGDKEALPGQLCRWRDKSRALEDTQALPQRNPQARGHGPSGIVLPAGWWFPPGGRVSESPLTVTQRTAPWSPPRGGQRAGPWG